jgi:PhnB protein
MHVQGYLMFEGRCEEALDFNAKALDAEIAMVLRFREAPDGDAHAGLPPGAGDKIQHASFRIGETTLLASDGLCSGQPAFQGVVLTLSVPSKAEAGRRFAALAEGGEVRMPLAETFFSPRFGMLQDRFGIGWMVITEEEGRACESDGPGGPSRPHA